MTNAQVNCFISAVRNLSFSRAAEELSITQPAVSRLVSQLELELGFPLFDRTQKGVQLTPAGKLLHSFFIRYREELSDTLEDAKQLNSGYSSTLHIGCRDAWDIDNFYPPIESFFAENYPNLKLILEGYDSSSMVQALKRGHVDVVISVMSHLQDNPEIVSRRLTSTGSHLIFSARHPLADKPDLEFKDFREYPFFTINEPDGPRNTSKLIREYCATQGFDPIITDLPTFTTELIKVQSGQGVVLTDDWMLVKSSHLFRFIRTDMVYDIGIGWVDSRKNPNKNLFINELLFYYKRLNAR